MSISPLSIKLCEFKDAESRRVKLAGEEPCNAAGGQIVWDYAFAHFLDCAKEAAEYWRKEPERISFTSAYWVKIDPLTVFYLDDREGYLFADQLEQVWHARVLDTVAADERFKDTKVAKFVANIMTICFNVTADRINIYVPQLDQL